MSGLELRAGTEVPGFDRHLDTTDLVAYAGATWDWHRLHHDAAYLERAGLPAPVVDGQVFGAYLVEQVQDWAGPLARVLATEFRFRRMVFAGQTVQVRGTVTEVEVDGDRTTVVVEQVISVGEDTVVTGTTTVSVPT